VPSELPAVFADLDQAPEEPGEWTAG
jgi:hypothetical protein